MDEKKAIAGKLIADMPTRYSIGVKRTPRARGKVFGSKLYLTLGTCYEHVV